MFRQLVASSSKVVPAMNARAVLLTSSRGFASSVRASQKAPLGPSSQATTPLELLTKIGRGAEKRLAAQGESWDKLNAVWMKGGDGVRDSGLNVKDRRYVLWAFSRYSQGMPIDDVVRPPTPAKKYRGWGARVQKGVRVK